MEGRKPTGVHSIVTPGDATDGSGGGDSDDDRNADADGELSSPQPRSGPAAAPSAPTGSRAPPTQTSSTNPPKKVHVGPNDDDDDLFDIDAMIEEDDLERRRQENAPKASASGKSPAKAIVVDDDDDELWAGMMDIDDLTTIDSNPNQGKSGADKGKGKVVDEVEDEEMWDALRDMEERSGAGNNDSNASRKEGVPPTRASMPVDGEEPAPPTAGGNAAKVVVDDPGDWDDMYFND